MTWEIVPLLARKKEEEKEKKTEYESRDQVYICFLIGSDVGQVENHNSLKELAEAF